MAPLGPSCCRGAPPGRMNEKTRTHHRLDPFKTYIFENFAILLFFENFGFGSKSRRQGIVLDDSFFAGPQMEHFVSKCVKLAKEMFILYAKCVIL